MRIQVDMFAVELGASLLLQFETPATNVTVLADAGHAKYKVNEKLQKAVSAFQGDTPLHIDLMIGTHYDSDHLAGLVDIIDNENVTIGEAWLPPVANETIRHTADATPEDKHLLALQFASEDGDKVLLAYLEEQATLCDQISAVTRHADPHVGIQRRSPERTFSAFRSTGADADAAGAIENYEAYFRAHIEDANRTLGTTSDSHADEAISNPFPFAKEMATLRSDSIPYFDGIAHLNLDAFQSRWKEAPDRAAVESASLALIQKSKANKAITASTLNKVVTALKRRNPRVPIRCPKIEDGKPRYFNWDPAARRFNPMKKRESAGPRIVLLGPSEGLVKLHWDKLPLGDYAYMAAFKALPVHSITESNQLSFIMAFEHADQRLLVAGDAGCVDFMPKENEPHPALIAEMSKLDVVQVAHHAGHNKYFYHCLQAAAFPKQDTPSYLLLSHKTDDPDRPSDVFSQFMESIDDAEDRIQLLFTSQPLAAKVRDVRTLIAPVTGGPKAKNGDLRLVFNDGQWMIARHAVSVP